MNEQIHLSFENNEANGHRHDLYLVMFLHYFHVIPYKRLT
jgi:hypothetical protein